MSLSIDIANPDTVKRFEKMPQTARPRVTGMMGQAVDAAASSARAGGGSAESQLKQLYQSRERVYDSYYAPLSDALTDSISEQQIVKSAERTAADMETRTKGMTDRQVSRYAGTPMVAQRRVMDKAVQDQIDIARPTVINQGRAMQRDHDASVRRDVMAVSQSLLDGSTEGLAQVAANKYQRDRAYEEAKGNLTSNILGTVGAVAGSVIAPGIGGYIGAGIGTQIGSM